MARSRHARNGAVVSLADEDHPRGGRPRGVVLILAAIIAGASVGYLASFPRSPGTGEQQGAAVPTSAPPMEALVQELADALAAGEAERMTRLLSDEPVLQLPGPFPDAVEASGREAASFLVAVEFRLALSDCRRRPHERYEALITCRFRATDALAEALGVGPRRGWMDFGVEEGLIRATLVRTTDETPEGAAARFWNWIEVSRPHELAHWFGRGTRRPLVGEDAALALLRLADEYVDWAASPERHLSPPPTVGPSYRAGHVMDYDPHGGRVLLLGGSAADLWAFDYQTRAWSQLEETDERVRVPAAASDTGSNLLVVLGSDWEAEVTTVWIYAPTSGGWQQQGNAPMYRDEWWTDGWMRAVYDDESDRVVVATDWGRFWAYDPDEDRWTERLDPWSEWQPVSLGRLGKEQPPCVGWLPERPMVYDTGSDLVVVAGRGDVCVYDVDTDTLTIRRTGDAPREVSAVAYDEESDRVVLLGDAATWVYHTPSGLLERVGPVVEGLLWRNAAMAYDQEADRMVVFDGATTWIYDLNTNGWTALHDPTGAGPFTAPRTP